MHQKHPIQLIRYLYIRGNREYFLPLSAIYSIHNFGMLKLVIVLAIVKKVLLLELQKL
jgi:hypothetical protein